MRTCWHWLWLVRYFNTFEFLRAIFYHWGFDWLKRIFLNIFGNYVLGNRIEVDCFLWTIYVCWVFYCNGVFPLRNGRHFRCCRLKLWSFAEIFLRRRLFGWTCNIFLWRLFGGYLVHFSEALFILLIGLLNFFFLLFKLLIYFLYLFFSLIELSKIHSNYGIYIGLIRFAHEIKVFLIPICSYGDTFS